MDRPGKITSADAREMDTHRLLEILERGAMGIRVRMEAGIEIPGYNYSASDLENVSYVLMERGY